MRCLLLAITLCSILLTDLIVFIQGQTPGNPTCDVCGFPNAIIMNPNLNVSVAFLNIGGVEVLTCDQILQAGLQGLIEPLNCQAALNQQDIQAQCGCTMVPFVTPVPVPVTPPSAPVVPAIPTQTAPPVVMKFPTTYSKKSGKGKGKGKKNKKSKDGKGDSKGPKAMKKSEKGKGKGGDDDDDDEMDKDASAVSATIADIFAMLRGNDESEESSSSSTSTTSSSLEEEVDNTLSFAERLSQYRQSQDASNEQDNSTNDTASYSDVVTENISSSTEETVGTTTTTSGSTSLEEIIKQIRDKRIRDYFSISSNTSQQEDQP